MKKIFTAAMLAGGLAALASVPTQAQDLVRGNVLVPASSREKASDIGRFAHTNHLILMRPASVRPDSAVPGESPQSLRAVYQLPSTGGSGTIAIVDAYDFPTAKKDFNTYATQFGLPKETSTTVTAGTNKVFQVKYASGTKPAGDTGWNEEEALDIEIAHGMSPKAKIVLVEAKSNSFNDLFAAVTAASKLPGVREISMSWGGSEFSGETSFDSKFSNANAVYLASSGDNGSGTIYPSVSKKVVAAGGTAINRDGGGNFVSETGWSGSGGGKSTQETRPSYQNGIQSIVGTQRGVPDYSFDADPNTGVAVYDSGIGGWAVFGGTSVSSPALAGIINLAGNFTSTANELATIYAGLGGADFRDITSGSNGAFSCKVGWDFVTGVGSDIGLSGK